jgi:hypothetical protein
VRLGKTGVPAITLRLWESGSPKCHDKCAQFFVSKQGFTPKTWEQLLRQIRLVGLDRLDEFPAHSKVAANRIACLRSSVIFGSLIGVQRRGLQFTPITSYYRTAAYHYPLVRFRVNQMR